MPECQHQPVLSIHPEIPCYALINADQAQAYRETLWMRGCGGYSRSELMENSVTRGKMSCLPTAQMFHMVFASYETSMPTQYSPPLLFGPRISGCKVFCAGMRHREL